MKLIISEKDIAARRIAYILSEGKSKSSKIGKTPVYEFSKDNVTWKIIGLKGHIINVDFPAGFNQWHKISPMELIEVNPCKKVSEKGIAAALKSLAEQNPFLIVATDYDREGELIGVEIVDLLKEYNKNINQIKRAKFSAITTQEINEAFDKLVDIDYNLSDAGESRQVIDLIWGAVLTRFISLTTNRLGKDFLSIGRVQSPTLALLVNREKEIKNFKPVPFWKIIATLKKEQNFNATHKKNQFWDENEANEIFKKVESCKEAKIKKVDKKILNETPPIPFNTTTFLESASYLGFSAVNAMSIAEQLYIYGLTSYPRTDNTVYPPSLNLKVILQKLLKSEFSKEAQEVLNNGRAYPTRGKKQTTDHPPIHPVGVPINVSLNPNQQKIYELICRRFLATLAKDAISETVDVSIDISNEEFKASGYKLIEPNWRSIYPYFKEKGKPLPELIEGQIVEVIEVKLNKDHTKPPQRYTQGSLIGKMEELMLGTKSTRHEIIQKLFQRKYITFSPLAPTPTGIAVIEAMGDCDVVKPKMTAILEKDMDLISEGKKTLDETVKESRHMLTNVMMTLQKDSEKIRTSIKNAHREQNTVGKCPKCGKPLMVRTSKKKKRFVGCSGFPECKNTYSLPQKGGIILTEKVCSECSTPIVKIKPKSSRAWELCLNSQCPAKKPYKNK